MKHEFTTIKVWTETRKLLRLIAALTGESLVEAMHRLASEEAIQRLAIEKSQRAASDPHTEKAEAGRE